MDVRPTRSGRHLDNSPHCDLTELIADLPFADNPHPMSRAQIASTFVIAGFLRQDQHLIAAATKEMNATFGAEVVIHGASNLLAAIDDDNVAFERIFDQSSVLAALALIGDTDRIDRMRAVIAANDEMLWTDLVSNTPTEIPAISCTHRFATRFLTPLVELIAAEVPSGEDRAYALEWLARDSYCSVTQLHLSMPLPTSRKTSTCEYSPTA